MGCGGMSVQRSKGRANARADFVELVGPLSSNIAGLNCSTAAMR